jgi:TnpA family transposase
MMKKLASYPKQNGLAKALREIGRIERALFMLDWFRDPSLRRRVQAGLNKGEAPQCACTSGLYAPVG